MIRVIRFSLLSAFALLFALPAFAQTGKIQGTVTDGRGDALIGVNVVIEGTTQGAQTDLDGEFVIIGVRPGQYTVVARYIGFATERKEGVGVSVDLTTTVDFKLREEVFEGEEVIVEASAETVRRDVTSSEARVNSETIDRLPVQEISDVLSVQAGVTNQNGNIHIRGGRSSEVTVMVDGVPVTDAYNGSAAVQLENDGIEELQVISGTFNAEFGNAMSGIINVVTKEGSGDKWGGSFEAYTGSYLVTGDGGDDVLRGLNSDESTVNGIQYRDVDPYSYLDLNPTHYSNTTLALEGPILGDRVTLFALGRYFRNDGWVYGSRIFNIDGTAGDSALVPLGESNKFSGQANLRIRLNDKMIVNLIALGSTAENRSADFSRRWSPDGRQRNYDDGLDTKMKFTHLLSSKSFYTVDIARFSRTASSRLYDDVNDPRYNNFNLAPPDTVEVRPGEFVPVLTGGGRFLRGGTDLGRFERTTTSYFAKADFTSQVGKAHLIKLGVQAKFDNLRFEGFAIRDGDNDLDGLQPEQPAESSLDFNSFDDVKPFTISAYIQDKMEFESFVVNAGLRFDYFDSRGRVPTDPSDPNIFNPFKKINIFRDTNGDGVITADEETDGNRRTVEERREYWYTDVEAKYQLSPRLGIAYPITDRGIIRFSYGYFLQIPTLDRLFDQYDYKLRQDSGTYGIFGNPDLDAERTSMYEIGIKQGLGDFTFEAVGYYRDVRNWVGVSPVITTEQPGVNYLIWSNRDYANVRGITLELGRAFVDGWGFNGAYTFQVGDGGFSDQNQQFFLGDDAPLSLLPLGWDQRHKFAGSVYVGGNGWGGSLLGEYGAGFPYTPAFPTAAQVGKDVQSALPENSRRLPTTFRMDLNVFREFQLGRFRPRVFAQVYNLFDARNVQGVYGDTGRPDVTQDQLRRGAYDPGFYVQQGFYSEPRRMHLGVDIRF